MSKTSRLLLLHVLLLALAREIEHPRSSDARRVLAPLRPVGSVQGRCAASGLLNFWKLFLSGDICVPINQQYGYRTTEDGGKAVKRTVERRKKKTT